MKSKVAKGEQCPLLEAANQVRKIGVGDAVYDGVIVGEQKNIKKAM